MFEMDHVAVPCPNIASGVAFYVDNFGAQVLYQDATWAFLKIGQGKLALVTPSQHPPHLALRVDEEILQIAAQKAGKSVDSHRDGTQGIYIEDLSGNVIELICYPPGETLYSHKK